MLFKALASDSIVLHLITEENLSDVYAMFSGFPDSAELIAEIKENYVPQYSDGKRTKYGFYALLNDQLAGVSLLSVDSFKECIGSTGADTLLHMRGKGVAPASKPHLFYLAFELLHLNRVETGCLISNHASKRSIEKTPGFQLEGIQRESGINENGEFEDQYIYAILKSDWLRLYDKTQVNVIY
jgi:RimJ/RimL family protein N-acetyltransferase